MIGLRATNFAEVVVGDPVDVGGGAGRGASVSVLTRANVPQRPDGGTAISRCRPTSLGWSHGCTPAVPQRRPRPSPAPPRTSASPASPSARSTRPTLRAPGPSTAGSAAASRATSSATPGTTAATTRRSTRSPARSSTGGRTSSGASSRTACSGRTSRPAASTSTGPSSASAGRSATRWCWRSAARGSRAPRSRRGWASAAGSSGSREVGRTGAYLSVVTGGTVRPGDAIEVVPPAGPRHHRAGHLPGVHG